MGRRKSIFILAGLSLALVLALVFGAWWLGRGPSQREIEGAAEAASASQKSPSPAAPTAGPGPQRAGGLEAAIGQDTAPAQAPAPASPSFLPRAQTEISLADVLESAGDLSVPGNRERAVAQMREIERAKRLEAIEQAQKLGVPIRITTPDGRVQELAGFENGRPVYFTTHNQQAAISTGAAALRSDPYLLSGTGVTVGVWDGGSVRASHQEFATGARVVVKDGSVSIDHATHVGGTIAAAGVVINARGMAPAAVLDSYDWNSDKSEMTARAAAAPNEAGKLYLSNHSYGYISGWNFVNGGSPFRVWEWYGDGTSSTASEFDFGRYNSFSRESDALAFSAPYYLMLRSAGNERTDNPSNGQAVALAPGSSTVVAYDNAIHPAGDGAYRGGFENVSFDALAKNVMTVGSVTDAVTGGTRSVSSANASSFSSWGPTDDGRIKPDVVANGDGLYSSLNGSNSSYGTYSGTSMATPNATGTAALLIQEYGRLFPGGAMRSSTLKGLMIHTADDRGHPGPDYKYGWGLVNGVAAAELIRDHAANPLKARMTEGLITSATATANHDFVWDGVSPIRATLAWVDPAGTATTTHDLRTPRLVNNLHLKITGPAGSEHLPYVMPFVGTWTQSSMDLPATTGVNHVDNVEQVLIAAPPAPGVYRCVITFSGSLANNQQPYSLLVSGSANEEPPPPPLTITNVAPNSALPGAATVDLTGTGFKTGINVKLTRSGQPDITASNVVLTSSTALRCQFNLTGAAPGLWSVRAQNPDGETHTLSDAFAVIGALWSEGFDGAVSGWTSAATTGANTWELTSAQSHSPPTSYFAPAPASKTTCNLTSPGIPIPANATGMQLRFWHSYNLQSTRDAGKLEFSIDNGAWFDVIASNSGVAFASNGYNSTVNNTGQMISRNEFAGQQAWSGNSGGFIETIVNFTDAAKYAGKTLRARWRIATNNGTASPGWYLDSMRITGNADLSNEAPVIASAATSTSTETATDPDGTVFQIVRGQSIGLNVAAADDGGEPALTFTWSASHDGGIPPSFSPNATHAAKTTTAFFEASGDYVVTVTVRDVQGLSTSSSVNIRVAQTASEISISPGTASVTVGNDQAFAATVLDQFGEPAAGQPGSFGWTTTGGGSIGATGMFTATTAGGPFIIKATHGTLTGNAAATVNPAPATVILSNATHTYDGTPKTVTVTTEPAGLSVSVTYDGGLTPPAAVGTYVVHAAITDPNYQGIASGILVIQPRQFPLTVVASPAEGGTVTGAGSFDEGARVPITATAAAGWRFDSWAGSGVDDPASAAATVLVDAAKTVTATFELLGSYEIWASSMGLAGAAAGVDRDPDGDGLANLIEYALGLDPHRRSDPLDVRLAPDQNEPAVQRLTVSFARPLNLPDVTYHIWASSDLISWEEVTDVTVTPGPEAGDETVVARDSVPATAGRRFAKLEVRLLAPAAE